VVLILWWVASRYPNTIATPLQRFYLRLYKLRMLPSRRRYFFAPKRIAVAGAGFAVLAGVITLLGWIFDLPRLTDWTNAGISMFPNAALCGMLVGGSILLRSLSSTQLFLARMLAALAAAIAALVLFQHITGVNTGIDTLLIQRPWGQNAAAAPMRMGPPASSAYLLLGIAAVLSSFGPRVRQLTSILAIGTSLIALLSLTGFLLGADQLFGMARFTGIALQTSIVIAVLSISMMAIVAEHGLAELLTRDDTGGAVFRRLLVPIIVVPLLLGWLRIVGQNAGLYDLEFGTALRSLIEIVLLFGLLWWTANNISWHENSAQSAQSRLAAIIESSDDAIISKSLEGAIQTWNVGAERTFGYTSAEAIGKHVTMLLPPERIGEETEILDRIRRGERIEHFETVRVRKDGVRIDVSLTVSPVKNSLGEIIGVSKIARDITARKQMETEREVLLLSERTARTDAEKASQIKDEFLTTLSHELRTPLNAIVGWSQILNPESDREELTEGLDAIRRNGFAQTRLIEDLLDMSRIVSGKVRLDVQSLDLSSVINAAIDTVRPTADAKGIKIRKVLDPSVGMVSGDPTRLQQVVWNLLTNAIKFTPKEGKVDVILERVNSHVELTVHDSGIGIPAEHLPVIFDRFRQVDSSTTRSYGGLGLGLAIVKQLVELHGGSVHAKSEGEGKGTTFIIHLPVSPIRGSDDRRHPAAVQATQCDLEKIDLQGVKVLVVDDEADARLLVDRVLAQCGAEIRLAGSAEEGLDQVRNFQPQVIISDIGMPLSDGYDFISRVRRLSADEGGKTPAIALTAFARSEDRIKALLAGYQVHVVKPIEPRELAVMVHSLCR
jgi:PAS domain S-box-containing protein